jgi:hypothetical protein
LTKGQALEKSWIRDLIREETAQKKGGSLIIGKPPVASHLFSVERTTLAIVFNSTPRAHPITHCGDVALVMSL